MKSVLAGIVLLFLISRAGANDQTIVVGSKNFTESYLLAEIMAQALESEGFTVERRFGFGGTKVCYEALRNGEIDVYPEYTGTIQQVVLKTAEPLDVNQLSMALLAEGLRILKPLGFNNTYALAISEKLATRLDIERISDLAHHKQLRAGFSHEFLNRPDGWPRLVEVYELGMPVTGIEHGLAYQAIETGEIDITDAYSTDGDLARYALRILVDDRTVFPAYLAVPFIRDWLDLRAVEVLDNLAGTFSDESMRRWNAEIVVTGMTIPEVAGKFLASIDQNRKATEPHNKLAESMLRNTGRHLELTFTALILACIIGTGLAVLVYRSATWSGIVVYVAGLLQTIPSIALLALMIPLLGVGMVPAITALFLYSLLPIVRSAVTALTTVDPVYREVATAMGLTRSQQLRHVLIPLAAPHILAGIRTAAVISIGTATLAAFIGAGGLGEPIVTGLALNDTNLILQGAIPAALLAILAELAFSGLERLLIPAHLRAH
jgi:osmoprotectant transport system permease protein